MKPLQAIAMGLVIVAIHPVSLHAWDPLPDPLGWLLVGFGVMRLSTMPFRAALLSLGVLALAVSVPLWFPRMAIDVSRMDVSLQWSLGLPQACFVALLAWALADAARTEQDVSAFRTWRTVATFAIVVALLPVLVFGGGLAQLTSVAATLGSLILVAVVVLCFVHASRPWALPEQHIQGQPQVK